RNDTHRYTGSSWFGRVGLIPRPASSDRRRRGHRGAGLLLVAVPAVPMAEVGERHRERPVLHLPDVAELVAEEVVGRLLERRPQEDRVPGGVAVEPAKPRQPEERRPHVHADAVDPDRRGIERQPVEPRLRPFEGPPGAVVAHVPAILAAAGRVAALSQPRYGGARAGDPRLDPRRPGSRARAGGRRTQRRAGGTAADARHLRTGRLARGRPSRLHPGEGRRCARVELPPLHRRDQQPLQGAALALPVHPRRAARRRGSVPQQDRQCRLHARRDPGLKTSDGLKMYDPVSNIYSFYETPIYTKCIGFEAFSMRKGSITSSFYTASGVVYGFALTAPGEAICQ